jgi:hypothetical protein
MLSSLSSAQGRLLTALEAKMRRIFGSSPTFMPHPMRHQQELMSSDGSSPPSMQHPMQMGLSHPMATSLALAQSVSAFGHADMQYSHLNHPVPSTGYSNSDAATRYVSGGSSRFRGYHYMDE